MLWSSFDTSTRLPTNSLDVYTNVASARCTNFCIVASYAALFGRADVALFPFTFCAQTILGLAGQLNQSMALT
jgi:hypothetical protein